MNDPQETKKLLHELVWRPLSAKAMGRRLEEAAGLTQELELLVANFRDNLAAVSGMSGLPAKMAAAVIYERKMALLSFARELELGRGKGTEEQDREIKIQARHDVEVQLREEGVDLDTALEYASVLADAFRDAVEDLLRESLVLIWGAIEVLATDLLIALINSHPSLVDRLNEDERSRRYFGIKSVPLETLQRMSYDVSQCMGELVVAQHAVDNVSSMKAAFLPLFSEDVSLRAQLDRRELYILNQKRNLIVHRRGIVDNDFAQRVTDCPPIGTRILVINEDVSSAINLALDVGSALLRSAAGILK